MKRKVLVALAVTQLALFGSFAHADIVVFSGPSDVCSTLQGKWTGEGSISAMGGIIKCSYTGTGIIPADQFAAHDFSMHVTLKKQSGICPSNEDLTLAGTCDAGVLTLKSSEANLSGNLNSSGTESDNIKGTVKVGSFTANVDHMTLRKS